MKKVFLRLLALLGFGIILFFLFGGYGLFWTNVIK